MEIIYEQGGYRIKHDGRVWDTGELEKHLSNNNHPEEQVHFIMPSCAYQGARQIAERIDRICNRKAFNTRGK